MADQKIARFWERQLATIPHLPASATPVVGLFDSVEALDVTLHGCHGDPIKAWFSRPAQGATRGVVVEFLGYGRGRGKPFERLQWNAAGFAHLLMDTRGQGSQYGSGGETPDPHGSGPQAPGFMTKGIDSPENLYYARLIADGVAAVRVAQELAGHEIAKAFLAGNSQGGGIALAVSGLVSGLGGVMANVPMLCDIEPSIIAAHDGPYMEARQYLSVFREQADQVFDVLSYVDNAILCRMSVAPLLACYGLQDSLIPAGGVRAMFDAYGSLGAVPDVSKELTEYRFNGHDGGDALQTERQIRWLRALTDGAAA